MIQKNGSKQLRSFVQNIIIIDIYNLSCQTLLQRVQFGLVSENGEKRGNYWKVFKKFGNINNMSDKNQESRESRKKKHESS